MNQCHKAIILVCLILILTYCSFAMYDTHTGRFMQQDPLGYVDGMNLFEYVHSTPIMLTDPTGLYYPLPMPPLPDEPARIYAISTMASLIAKHNKYQYASITGLDQLLLKLQGVIGDVEKFYFNSSLEDNGEFVTHSGPIFFLPDYMTFNPTSASEYTVFHELIHAYLHYKKGLDSKYNSIHEGITWSAERMLYSLDEKMIDVEDTLNSPEPDDDELRLFWNRAWQAIAGYTTGSGYIKDGLIIGLDLSHYNRGPTNKCDVMRVKNQLGFSISCASLAQRYTEIIQKKPNHSCYKFTCDVSSQSTDISLSDPLIHDVFR